MSTLLQVKVQSARMVMTRVVGPNPLLSHFRYWQGWLLSLRSCTCYGAGVLHVSGKSIKKPLRCIRRKVSAQPIMATTAHYLHQGLLDLHDPLTDLLPTLNSPIFHRSPSSQSRIKALPLTHHHLYPQLDLEVLISAASPQLLR